MYLRVLIENTAYTPALCTEHGLSLYLETNGKRILFDCGQSDAFSRNAALLGIHVSSIDLCILSHGHYDHGGGIHTFLSQNSHAPVYIRRDAFGRHFSGTEKEIGIDPSLKNHPQIILTEDETILSPHLRLLTLNGEKALYPLSNENMLRMENGQLTEDRFLHEQYLLIEEAGKRILISGCSHKGVLNLMHWLRPDVLIGGFHWKSRATKGESGFSLLREADMLARFPARFYTCHCTGENIYAFIEPRFKGRIGYLSCGCELTL
ncbi:MAG: MBL fold metallo-hydrolase [Clostridia bacterium]|nr:MBL fold metallo-hydrolase [Clostridia bacterium]